MFTTLANHTIVGIVLVAFTLTLISVPTESHAQWRRRDGDLPGTTDITPYLIVAGVAVVVLIVVVISKKGKEAPAEVDKEDADTKTQGGQIQAWQFSHEQQDVRAAAMDKTHGISHTSRMEPICVLKSDGFGIGVKVQF